MGVIILLSITQSRDISDQDTYSSNSIQQDSSHIKLIGTTLELHNKHIFLSTNSSSSIEISQVKLIHSEKPPQQLIFPLLYSHINTILRNEKFDLIIIPSQQTNRSKIYGCLTFDSEDTFSISSIFTPSLSPPQKIANKFDSFIAKFNQTCNKVNALDRVFKYNSTAIHSSTLYSLYYIYLFHSLQYQQGI